MVNRHLLPLFVLILASAALLTPAAVAQTSVAPPVVDAGLEKRKIQHDPRLRKLTHDLRRRFWILLETENTGPGMARTNPAPA